MGMVAGSDFGAALGRLGRAWGWIVAYGVLSVLAGIVAIIWPRRDARGNRDRLRPSAV
jgi:uncharacterized membrane protein HdeD (DUF308 family)